MKTLKNNKNRRMPFLIGAAEICALLVMTCAFIAGVYVEQYFWAMPDRVNFKQCLPWFAVFTYGTMYFNSVFSLDRRKHHLAFSAFVSVILINLLMMALPFFEVLYYIQVTTLLTSSFSSAWACCFGSPFSIATGS